MVNWLVQLLASAIVLVPYSQSGMVPYSFSPPKLVLDIIHLHYFRHLTENNAMQELIIKRSFVRNGIQIKLKQVMIVNI